MTEISPMDWALRPLKKYAVFRGRASRSEYWWFYLFTIVLSVVTSVMDVVVAMALNIEDFSPISTLTSLALAVPSVAVTARRLHDTDRSAWWLFIITISVVIFAAAIIYEAVGANSSADTIPPTAVVGIVGVAIAAIILMVFLVLPGTRGPNRYGPDPYGPGNLEEVFA